MSITKRQKSSILTKTYEIEASPSNILTTLSSLMDEIRNNRSNGVFKINFHLGGIRGVEYVEEEKLMAK